MYLRAVDIGWNKMLEEIGHGVTTAHNGIYNDLNPRQTTCRHAESNEFVFCNMSLYSC